jgi:hypothetical protein
MIDKGDIPSIQCKMSLRRPESMRKVDGVSLIFIDFYVAALTPRLNSTETSLKFSENITLFAICRIYTGVISRQTYIDTRCLGRIIYIHTLYNVGDKTELCGTLACMSLGIVIPPSTETQNFQSKKRANKLD